MRLLKAARLKTAIFGPRFIKIHSRIYNETHGIPIQAHPIYSSFTTIFIKLQASQNFSPKTKQNVSTTFFQDVSASSQAQVATDDF